MKLRRLMIGLAFCSQLAMATPTCGETCLATAEAAAKQCATLPLDQLSMFHIYCWTQGVSIF